MPKTIKSDHEVHFSEVYSVEELSEYTGYAGKNLEKLDSQRLKQTPPYTIAAFLSRLSVDDCRTVLRKVPELDASAILSEMDADASAEIVAAMREWRALKILEEFDLDDAADVISELEEPDRVRLLSKLSPEKASTLRTLLKYESDTAGGVMTPSFVAVKVHMTVDEAIDFIRKNKDDASRTSYVYVLDDQRHLKGVLSLKSLILAKPDERIADIMTTDLKGVCSPNEDREKIALAMAELNLFDLPVVDSEGRLLGIVEHDDVIDILQTEATEDFQKIVGAGGDEAMHDPMMYSIKRRGPWLLVNLLNAFIAAGVITFFRGQIEQISYLAVFMPIVASLAGNTGAQTLAVAIRSIALGEIESFDDFKICFKEGLKGVINGLLVGTLSAIMVYIMANEIKISIVIFMAVILNMGLGGIAGAFIPLMLKRLNFDPAQSSSIFLTGLTDACGFLIFLSLGSWLLF